MSDTDLELLIQYPLIQKHVNNNEITYKGIVEINDEDFRIELKQTQNFFKFTELNDLNGHTSELNTLLVDKRNVLDVLRTFKDFVIKTLPKCAKINPVSRYRTVLQQYNEFTKFYLNLKTCRLLPDLTRICLSFTDDGQRIHGLEIAVDPAEKINYFKLENYDLPKQKFKINSNLIVLFEEVLGVVDQLQPYFNFMDTLDSSSCVLDPLHAKKCDSYRRINLGENASVLVTVDPYNVNQRPDLKFLGPERIVDLYRSRLNDNLESWDYNNDPFQQLLHLLGLEEFPQNNKQSNSDMELLKNDQECAICYSFNLGQKVPDVVCKNESCENVFHNECLFEWLMSINAKRVYYEIIGSCPNCEKPISCINPLN